MIQNQGNANLNSLSKLRESLNNYTQQELKLLERKNTELINEYNRLIHNYKNRKRHLDCLKKTQSDLYCPDLEDENSDQVRD